MSYKLSVLVPSIRPNNLLKLYRSVISAYSGSFEFITIGPNALPEDFRGLENARAIIDWGSPIRAQQIGLVESTGEYVTWAADDGIYLPASLDRAFQLLEGEDYKTVITGKYQEGERKDNNMELDSYYILNNHVASSVAFIPDNCWMLNCGLVSRKLLLEVGGWDAQKFQVCPMAYNDLAIRLQKYGCKFIIQQEIMFKCAHMPDCTGDHGPIHMAQVYFDEPMFREIWNHPYWSKRVSVALDNYRLAPARWDARFGKVA